MANLSQLRRQRMLAFLERMREQHKDDDEVLVAINEVENEINEKKYGLVWEELLQPPLARRRNRR